MEDAARLFLQLAPLEKVMTALRNVDGWPNIDAQTELVIHVLEPYCQAFPPSKRYLRSFYSKIQSDIELRSEDGLCDLLAEYIVSLQSIRVDSDEFDSSHTTYTFKNRHATFRTLRSHNQVGTRLWDAGLFLAEVCMARPKLLADRSVVELGAGCGVTGLLLGKFVADAESLPKSIIMTDHMHDVLNNLKFNIRINADERLRDVSDTSDIACDDSQSARIEAADPPSSSIPRCCDLSAAYLDWSEVSENDLQNLSADVLLAADCTYSPDICVQLISAMTKLLRRRQDQLDTADDSSIRFISSRPTGTVGEDADVSSAGYSNDSSDDVFVGISFTVPFGLVASTVRDPETFAYLLATIASSELELTDVTDWARAVAGPQVFEYNNRSSIKTFYFKLKS